ncbi:MAG: hypothetical protein ACREBQ_00745 [Nitrososphaerales archaeon]
MLITGLSLGIFLFSALIMYGAWLALDGLAPLARGIISLLFWIFAFSGSTYLFWKAIEKMTVTEVLR